MSTGEDLAPSALGTKEYWENAYVRERANFAADRHDEGQVWFSESDAETRVLGHLATLLADGDVPPHASYLDVGTGNGHLLFALIEAADDDDEPGLVGGPLVGVDYAPTSIELAGRIARERGVDGITRFEVADVLKDDLAAAEWVPEGGFDVVLDKGTFDAISLSEEVDAQGRRVGEGYAAAVARCMKAGGLLVVTSCNWTAEELRGRVEKDGVFRKESEIKYPSFTFGGKTGQTVVSLCFRKV